MQIHELPTISGSPSGGYFATDNGTQTTKIDYTALAQAIIEQYNASTLAGTAQSVKAALDGLDGNKLDLKSGTAITNSTDVNTLQTPGTYFCASASIAASLSNIPTQAATVGFRMDVARNGYNADNYLTQTLRAVSSGAAFEYVRGMSTEGTWGAWQKVPTRAEVDALSSNLGDIRSLNVSLTADTDGIAKLSKGVAAAINGVNSNISAGATVVARMGINSSTAFGILVKASSTTWFGMLTETATAKIAKLRWASGTPNDCTTWTEIE